MDVHNAQKLSFLRQYGPIAHNDNMYDEAIQRSARRHDVTPIYFDHPYHDSILESFDLQTGVLNSVILTGDAGDGKTHLCRQVWEMLGGDLTVWASNDPHVTLNLVDRGEPRTLHVIRDMSAWVPKQQEEWPADKVALLHRLCRGVFAPSASEDIFLVAVNDGQLVESFRRLPDGEHVALTRELIETLLVEDRQSGGEARLKLFNLSRCRSAEMLDRALPAFLAHPVWETCLAERAGSDEAFGARCPIRHNYELLTTQQVQNRLRQLFELCDYNDLHIPIRQILLLLSNAIFGHRDVTEHLMMPSDVPTIIANNTLSLASFYNNVFGGNLPEARRTATPVFDYFERFRVGHETSNRIDNILIFGGADESVRPYFDQFLAADTFYGADDDYRAAQVAYVEGAEQDDGARTQFLDQLVRQRRGLFLKIPSEQEEDLRLWDLTVFKYAGEYLARVVGALANERRVDRAIRARLVKGLNRIFVGMLVSSDRELLLATSLSFSSARVSRLLEESIAMEHPLGEHVDVLWDGRMPIIEVAVTRNITCRLELHLTRYEFLSRVAVEGALPSSFSKECYEDMLAFKSQILAALAARRAELGQGEKLALTFRLLELDAHNVPREKMVEVVEALDA